MIAVVSVLHMCGMVIDSMGRCCMQVFTDTGNANPMLTAIQLRLLRLLLCGTEEGETKPSLLHEVLRLSGK